MSFAIGASGTVAHVAGYAFAAQVVRVFRVDALSNAVFVCGEVADCDAERVWPFVVAGYGCAASPAVGGGGLDLGFDAFPCAS